jgi:hypothetical protein
MDSKLSANVHVSMLTDAYYYCYYLKPLGHHRRCKPKQSLFFLRRIEQGHSRGTGGQRVNLTIRRKMPLYGEASFFATPLFAPIFTQKQLQLEIPGYMPGTGVYSVLPY